MDDHVSVAGLCVKCTRAVPPVQPSSSQEVKGWRRYDPRGKALPIKDIVPTGRVLCAMCSTLDKAQRRLF